MKQMPPMVKCGKCGKIGHLIPHTPGNPVQAAEQSPRAQAIANVRAKMRSFTTPDTGTVSQPTPKTDGPFPAVGKAKMVGNVKGKPGSKGMGKLAAASRRT